MAANTNKKITSYGLYAHRYLIAYIALGIILTELLIVALLYIPGGLSQMERDSTVLSSQIVTQYMMPGSVINAPYLLLQYLSLALFGVTTLSIKLVSFIMALGSIVGILLLLRVWFAKNIAIITTLLVVTTSQFLFLAQNGTPAISYVFFPVWILLSALMISRKARFSLGWKITLFGVAAFSLYTPLTIYLIIALVASTLFHPHLRYIFRKLSKKKFITALVVSLIIITPLIRAVILEPALGLQLLGVPMQWPNLFSNDTVIISQYFDFIHSSSSTLITPIYGITSMLIIAIGIIGLFTTKYTARSYIITIWVGLLLLILVFNPRLTAILFVPMMLLFAFGIKRLFSMWYRLFPRNPYARAAGLIPLSILILSMVVSGANRYGYGYHYDPLTTQNFDQDVRIINNRIFDNTSLKRELTTPYHIVSSQSELAFYTAFASYRRDVTVSSRATLSSTATTIVTRSAMDGVNFNGDIAHVITDARQVDGDRFYLYKSTEK